MLKIFGMSIGVLVSILLLIAGLSFFGWGMYAWLGPKYVGTEYQIFKQSQPYQQGMIQDLQNMQMKYEDSNTTEKEKEAIRATVLQRFGSFDYRSLPPDLQAFYLNLKEKR